MHDMIMVMSYFVKQVSSMSSAIVDMHGVLLDDQKPSLTQRR